MNVVECQSEDNTETAYQACLVVRHVWLHKAVQVQALAINEVLDQG